jgi:hypothetical protein
MSNPTAFSACDTRRYFSGIEICEAVGAHFVYGDDLIVGMQLELVSHACVARRQWRADDQQALPGLSVIADTAKASTLR